MFGWFLNDKKFYIFIYYSIFFLCIFLYHNLKAMNISQLFQNLIFNCLNHTFDVLKNHELFMNWVQVNPIFQKKSCILLELKNYTFESEWVVTCSFFYPKDEINIKDMIIDFFHNCRSILIDFGFGLIFFLFFFCHCWFWIRLQIKKELCWIQIRNLQFAGSC